jgi:glycosyltransferase involved in cell wall biosynthesis
MTVRYPEQVAGRAREDDGRSPVPAVSVMMTVRDADEHFLRETLESLEAQTFRDFDVVLVLDGPDPVAERVWLEFERPGWQLVPLAEHQGHARAMNIGLRHCRAPLVARLDTDDIAEPDRLRLQVEAFEARPALGVLGTAAMDIDDESAEIGLRSVSSGARRVARGLLWRNALIHPSVMYRREVVEAVGGYNERFVLMEDYELWLRCVTVAEVDNLPQQLLRYRQHTGQASRRFRASHEPLGVLAESRRAAGRAVGARSLGVRMQGAIWRIAQELLGNSWVRRQRGAWHQRRGRHRP